MNGVQNGGGEGEGEGVGGREQRPKQPEGRQCCLAGYAWLVLATFATLLLLSSLHGWTQGMWAPGSLAPGGWVPDGWAGAEVPSSKSQTTTNGSVWLSGCPVGWSAAPGGQYLSTGSHTGPHPACCPLDAPHKVLRGVHSAHSWNILTYLSAQWSTVSPAASLRAVPTDSHALCVCRRFRASLLTYLLAHLLTYVRTYILT